MTQKETTLVRVNKELLNKMITITGISGSRALNSFLQTVLDGELRFYNGKWISDTTKEEIGIGEVDFKIY